MTELPTRSQIFVNCRAPLDAARAALSEARDWLRSDWEPIGAPLTTEAGEARMTVLKAIAEAKNLIDRMNSDISAAIESIEAADPAPPSPESLSEQLRSRRWTAWPSRDDDLGLICEVDEDDRGDGVDLNVYFHPGETASWIVGQTTHHAPADITASELADLVINTIREENP